MNITITKYLNADQLAGFHYDGEYEECMNLYLDMYTSDTMDPIVVSDRDGSVMAFAGLYDAPWGLTAVLIPHYDLKNPLALYRVIKDYLSNLRGSGLHVHCQEYSKTHRMMYDLGFEFDTYAQTEMETLLRFRLKEE